jgi:hypothetical protein
MEERRREISSCLIEQSAKPGLNGFAKHNHSPSCSRHVDAKTSFQ